MQRAALQTNTSLLTHDVPRVDMIRAKTYYIMSLSLQKID